MNVSIFQYLTYEKIQYKSKKIRHMYFKIYALCFEINALYFLQE